MNDKAVTLEDLHGEVREEEYEKPESEYARHIRLRGVPERSEMSVLREEKRFIRYS